MPALEQRREQLPRKRHELSFADHSFDVRRRRACRARSRCSSSNTQELAPLATRASKRCGKRAPRCDWRYVHVEDAAPIPRFAPPARARDFVVLVLGIALIGGFSKAFWDTVAAAIPSGLEWLNPLESGELYERALSVFTFIVYEGTAMWTATLNLVGAALVIALVAWLAVTAVRPRAFAAVAASLLAVVIALPSIGHAFEIRRATGLVTLAAGETIDDTLARGGRDDRHRRQRQRRPAGIRPQRHGARQRHGRSDHRRRNHQRRRHRRRQRHRRRPRRVVARARRVGRNLYGFGHDVSVDAAAEVAGNALAFGESVDINGRVGTDFKGFGANVTVSGAVEGDVEGFAGKITLLPSARVGGNVTAHVDSVGRSRDRVPGPSSAAASTRSSSTASSAATAI